MPNPSCRSFVRRVVRWASHMLLPSPRMRRAAAGGISSLLTMRLSATALLLAGVIAAASPATAEEWNRFRGPNGSGVGQLSKPLPGEWTDKEYAWKVELPAPGHASPVLWKERLLIACGEEEQDRRLLLCFDADTGELTWSREFPVQRHRKHALNSFATASPAVDAQRIYFSWATPEEYVVVALDHDGKVLWRRDLPGYRAGHGHGASPIVHGDLVVVPNDQDGDSSLIGLDAASGELRWTVPRDSKTSYSTPCVYAPAGQAPQLIFTNWDRGISGHDPADGRPLWEAKVFGADHIESSIGSPIVVGDLVVGTAGWLGRGSHAVAVRPMATTGETAEVATAYHIQRGAPLSTTPLAVDGLLYLWADEGILTCADARTGEVHYRQRVGGTYYGSPVSAAGQIFCISADGLLSIVAAGPKYQLIGQIDLGSTTNSTPAIARDRLYIRTSRHLLAVRAE